MVLLSTAQNHMTCSQAFTSLLVSNKLWGTSLSSDWLSQQWTCFIIQGKGTRAKSTPQILNSEGDLSGLHFVRHPQLWDHVPVFPAVTAVFRELHTVWGKVTLNWTHLHAQHCPLSVALLHVWERKVWRRPFPFLFLQFSDGQNAANCWTAIEGVGQIRNPKDRITLDDSKNSTGQKKGIQVHSFHRPEMPVKLKSGFCFSLSPPTFSKDVLLFSAASLLL